MKEQLQTIGGGGRGRRQTKLARFPRGATHLEGRLQLVRHDTGYWRVAIEHNQSVPATYFPEMLAEVGLEIRDSDFAHDQIMAISSHLVKATATGVLARDKILTDRQERKRNLWVTELGRDCLTPWRRSVLTPLPRGGEGERSSPSFPDPPRSRSRDVLRDR